jgi:hypothetical protein
MHAVSSGGNSRSYRNGGGGGVGGSKSDHDDGKRSKGGGGGGGVGGGGGGKGKGGGTVYRIGNQKFTLDGKEGKTLDDIIEVLHQQQHETDQAGILKRVVSRQHFQGGGAF